MHTAQWQMTRTVREIHPFMTDLRTTLQSALGTAHVIERELRGGGMSRVFVASERATLGNG